MRNFIVGRETWMRYCSVNKSGLSTVMNELQSLLK